MRHLVRLFFLAFSLVLVGCGKYHGTYGSKYYVSDARVVHPLVVPEGIHSPVSEQYYVVPNKEAGYATPKLSLLPPDPVFKAYLAEHSANKKTYNHNKT